MKRSNGGGAFKLHVENLRRSRWSVLQESPVLGFFGQSHFLSLLFLFMSGLILFACIGGLMIEGVAALGIDHSQFSSPPCSSLSGE